MPEDQEIKDVAVAQPKDVAELLSGLPSIPDQEEYKKEIGTVDYFPYITLAQGQSDIVSTHGCKVGNFYLNDNDAEEPIDLGERFNGLLLSFRMKAMAYNNDEVINCYETGAEEFALYKERANARFSDSHKYLWGVEYLLWLPQLSKFVTFFCNNPTLRRASRETIHKLLSNKITLTHKFLEKGDYKWWGAVGTLCNANFDLPAKDELATTMDRFNNPPDRSVQNAPIITSDDNQVEEDR